MSQDSRVHLSNVGKPMMTALLYCPVRVLDASNGMLGRNCPVGKVRADFNCAGARGVSAQSNRLSCSENLTEMSLLLPTCWAKSCCDKRTAASCIISTTSSMLVAGS
ncbi:hypothetical protein L914_12182 [Phytophthora nicotianae]|uniref:Uncharacterized protein n=2 Tax=Phytophthora nicotianae TaxID=4792 RepID=W2N0A3_PHYNI|nr:hypothetical protein L914_12182 [Phytophthora nicotianae]